MIFRATFVISSEPRLLPALRGAMEQITAVFGWNQTDCRAIALALQEALTNKIRHAYRNRPDGVITMEIQARENDMEFRLTDQGDPPDPGKICARAAGSLTPGGLGTHIIRDVMDSVFYSSSAEGNHVVLIRRFPEARI